MFIDLTRVSDLVQHLKFKWKKKVVFLHCFSLLLILWPSHWLISITHINVLQCEVHRISQVHPARLLVDGGGDDVRVDGDRAVLPCQVTAQLYGCIFGTEETTQTFVNNENQFG